MDCFSLSTATSAGNFSALQFSSHSSRILSFNARKPRKLIFFASKDDSKLDKWEQMEFNFGRMIGEDPKFTYAKIMAKKANPELNYLEIEKLLEKKGGKARKYEIEEIPFDLPDKRKSTNSVNGLNLVRPVPRKGVDFEANRNAVETDDKKSSQPIRKPVQKTKSIVPNVILRKPRSYYEKDADSEKSSIFGMKPNLSLKMGNNPQKERFSDITLLKKPTPVTSEVKDETEDKSLKNNFSSAGKADDITLSEKPKLMNLNVNKEHERELPSYHIEFSSDITLSEKPKLVNLNVNDEQERELSSNHTVFGSDVTLSEKPKLMNLNENNGLERELSSDHTEFSSVTDVTKNSSNVPNASSDLVKMMDGNLNQSSETRKGDSGADDASSTELQAGEQISVETFNSSGASRTKSAESTPAISMDTLLIGKPKILDRSIKETEQQISKDTIPVNFENSGNQSELENFRTTSPIEDHLDKDWERAEKLLKTEERAEVELISSSTKGFVVSFGSLIGFLPYRNLLARWKFINFESWLRKKGIDPSVYRQNLGIIGKYEATSSKVSAESMLDSKADYKADRQISPDMKFEDLLMIYDQEKQKFLSSFVGQKTKVVFVMANTKNGRLIVSIKPKEKEDLVEKRRRLMEKLSVGDIVKCQITKMTYLGIFVEVEGVSALIHQAEVSWDTTLDLEAHFKVGQILEAKVIQLDFTVERIHLSLKSVTPDPLIEALEVVVGDHSSSGVQLEAAGADVEWADVEMLIKELQQVDGIESVSKGKYLLSPGLAPTFQVYMASMFENQYKLLARAGNRVQEVIVQSSLSKEELKSSILTCTNRVE